MSEQKQRNESGAEIGRVRFEQRTSAEIEVGEIFFFTERKPPTFNNPNAASVKSLKSGKLTSSGLRGACSIHLLPALRFFRIRFFETEVTEGAEARPTGTRMVHESLADWMVPMRPAPAPTPAPSGDGAQDAK